MSNIDYVSRVLASVRQICQQRDEEALARKAELEALENGASAPTSSAQPALVGFDAPFALLKTIGVEQSTKAAKHKNNAGKNRYNNVLPYDHSRVVLKGNGKADYINANWVDGVNQPRAYIATQAPVPDTIPDFWTMVWGEKVHLIVMATREVERNQLKCHRYWPDAEVSNTKKFGNVTVTVLNSSQEGPFLIREMEISHSKESKTPPRKIVQICYERWPDHGVPLTTKEFLDFRDRVNEEWKKHPGTPIIVHCSAGAGRSGTFIAIDRMLKEIDADAPNPDIDRICQDLRRCRSLMVQTVDQYVFIFRVVLDALHNKLLELERSEMSRKADVQAALQNTTEFERQQADDQQRVNDLISHSQSQSKSINRAEREAAERAWDAEPKHNYDLGLILDTVSSRFEALQAMGLNIQRGAVEQISRLVNEARKARVQAAADAAKKAAEAQETAQKQQAQAEEEKKLKEKEEAREKAVQQATKFMRKQSIRSTNNESK